MSSGSTITGASKMASNRLSLMALRCGSDLASAEHAAIPPGKRCRFRGGTL